MTLITRSVNSLCTQSSDLPWRIAGIMQRGRSSYKRFGWAIKKTLSCHEFGLATIGGPFASSTEAFNSSCADLHRAEKSQLWRAKHLHSDPDAPKTHCAKRVFSEPLPRDDDGKHHMTGTPSEHTTCRCLASPLLCRSQCTSRSATHEKNSSTLRLTFCATASRVFLLCVGTSQA